jgi:peptide deformylase
MLDRLSALSYFRLKQEQHMSIRDIIHLPDPVLREVSKPVERIDTDLLRLLDDMLETMYDAPGIGLAGIQIGVPRRIVTIDIGEPEDDEPSADVDESTPEGRKEARKKRKPQPFFLINPKVLWSSGDRSVYEEGCLSIPEYYAEVERPAAVKVSYLNRDGKEQVLDADGLMATCLQHEIDHLDGKLFIDHISRLKRDMVIKKFTKIARQAPKTRRMVG